VSLPGRLVDVGGTAVFVHRRGPQGAPTVVLLHGFLMSHFYYRHILPALAEHYDVIAIDLPGFGESDKPHPTRYPYSLAALGRTVIGLLDRLGVARAAVIGHSMGGGVAIDVAAQAPDRIWALVPSCAAAYEPPLPPEAALILAPKVGRTLFLRGYSRRRFANDLRTMAYRSPDMVPDEMVDFWWERLNRPGGREAAYAMLRELARLAPIADRLHLPLRPPTLLVWGEEDRLVPLDRARRLSRDLRVPLRIVPCTGHTPHEERPHTFVRLVLPFLEQAAQVSGGAETCRSAS
jgi:pimeloyl-ACP methyl ester carboxylesterase